MAEQDVRSAFYGEESSEAEVALLVVAHPDLPDMGHAAAPGGAIYLTDAGGAYDETAVFDLGDGETSSEGAYIFDVDGQPYICVPFSLTIPAEGDEAPRNGRLAIPNVDTAIGAALEAMMTPATVTLSIVLESDPTAVLRGPYVGFELRSVRGDALAIEGELAWPPLNVWPWPKDTIRPSKYRAAFRAIA